MATIVKVRLITARQTLTPRRHHPDQTHGGFGVSHGGFGVSHGGFGVSHGGFGVSHGGFGVSLGEFGVSLGVRSSDTRRRGDVRSLVDVRIFFDVRGRSCDRVPSEALPVRGVVSLCNVSLCSTVELTDHVDVRPVGRRGKRFPRMLDREVL